MAKGSNFGHMPIPWNSHSSKPMVTFIKNVKIGCLEQINRKAWLLTAFAAKSHVFPILDSCLVSFAPISQKIRPCGKLANLNMISMDVPKMHFDECDFPWNGFTTQILTWLLFWTQGQGSDSFHGCYGRYGPPLRQQHSSQQTEQRMQHGHQRNLSRTQIPPPRKIWLQSFEPDPG